MAYTPPAYPHLPDVDWSKAVTPPAEADKGGSQASRGDINEVASSPSDTQAQVAAENALIRLIYGQYAVGAQVADVLVYQGRLIVFAVWGQGPIDAIAEVWMGDAPLPSNVQATHYTGAPGQTPDATLVAAYAAVGVPYTDALPGIAYSVFSVPESESSGFPTFSARVRGLLVYDPRTETIAWSDNPALCLADFVSNPVYGWGRSVDWSTVIVAANQCDELVGGEKRRMIGLAMDQISECRQWVEVLRTYAGCFVSTGAEGFKLIPDRPI